MTCDSDRLLPILNNGLYRVDNNRSTENCSVENCTDSSVGALPHLGKVVLFNSLLVGGDGGTLYRNTVLLCSVSRVKGYLILGLFSFGKSQVIVLCFKVNEGKNKLILDHLPEYSCHFVAIHLNERGGHFYLIHNMSFLTVSFLG